MCKLRCRYTFFAGSSFAAVLVHVVCESKCNIPTCNCLVVTFDQKRDFVYHAWLLSSASKSEKTTARFHHSFRSPVSGTGIGTGTVMVSKTKQVQEQECKKVGDRNSEGNMIRYRNMFSYRTRLSMKQLII